MKKKNLLDHNNKILKQFSRFLFGHNRRLNHIIRFSTRLRTYDENVAAHSFYVGLYSLLLADIASTLGYKINFEKMIKMSLLHDLEECASGDVITLFKQKMKKSYNKLAEISILSVLNELPGKLKKEYSLHWKNHSEGTEGWLIKLADDLEGFVYSQEQIDTGNAYFEDIRNDYLKRIEKITKNTKLEFLWKELKHIVTSNPTQTISLHYDKENYNK